MAGNQSERSRGPKIHWRYASFLGGLRLHRTLRSLLAYERESDSALAIGSGIDERWVNSSAGVEVHSLPTHYDTTSYTVKRTIEDPVTVDLSGDVRVPKLKVIVVSMLDTSVRILSGSGLLQANHREALVDRLPA